MKDQQSHRPSAGTPLSLLAVVAVAILSLLSVLLSPSPARANSAPTRWMPGSGGLVVPTTTQDVKIERELLSFDLVSSRTTAQVRASYDLTNVSGREVELDAIFIGPGGRNLVLQKQGVVLPSRGLEQSEVQLPNQWLYPNRYADPSTGKDASMGAAASSGYLGMWAFQLKMAPGEQATLVAEYTAALGYSTRNSNRDLAYVLGPAKSWAGFGTLEVSALLPSADRLVTVPPLERIEEKDGVTRYGATFSGIPSEMFLATIVPGDSAEASPDGVITAGRSTSPGMDGVMLAVLGFPFLIAALFAFYVARASSTVGTGCRGVLTTVFAASLLTGAISTALTIGLIVLMGSDGYPDQTLGLGNSLVLAPLLAAVAGAALEVVMRRRSTRAGSSRAGGS